MNIRSNIACQVLRNISQLLSRLLVQSPAHRGRRRSGIGCSPVISLEALEPRCLLSTTSPSIRITNASIVETDSGTQNAVVTVSLNKVSPLPVTVRFTTENRTAVAGADYRAFSGTLTIPAGASATRLSFACYGDTLDEIDETFAVVFSTPTNAVLVGNTATITILDNDAPPLVSISDGRILEGRSGNSTASVIVALSASSGQPVTVGFRTQAVTATSGIDFRGTSGTIIIPAGQTRQTIPISIIGDSIDEPNETFRVILSNPVNANFGKSSALLTIEDDDGTQLPLFQLNDLAYLGSFALPTGKKGSASFEYGGNAIAFNPANNSLFMASNFDEGLNVAEVKIPAVLSPAGVPGKLPVASVLQAFVDLGQLLRVDAGGHATAPILGYEDLSTGGLLVTGNGLTGGMYMGYNGVEPEDSSHSHFRTNGLNLKALNSATFSGLMDIRMTPSQPTGRVHGGYMAEVPEQWRAWIGAKYVTGAAGQNRIQYSSSGPALFGFDAVNPKASSGGPLVYYPFGHALQWGDDSVTTPQLLFNGTTKVDGVAFVPGTRSVLFFGSNGLSRIGYGVGPRFNDQARQYQGYHSQNGVYKYQIWAYDIDDFAAVRSGTRASWTIRPTSVMNFDFPTPDASKYLGGTAFDPSTGRLYISQKFAGTNATPVIHVYQLGRPVLARAVAASRTIAASGASSTVPAISAVVPASGSNAKSLSTGTPTAATRLTTQVTGLEASAGGNTAGQQPLKKIGASAVISSATITPLKPVSNSIALTEAVLPGILSSAQLETLPGILTPSISH